MKLYPRTSLIFPSHQTKKSYHYRKDSKTRDAHSIGLSAFEPLEKKPYGVSNSLTMKRKSAENHPLQNPYTRGRNYVEKIKKEQEKF
jgi:hypothetical protein